MIDLKKVFDVGKLTEHELGCVEFVLNSPAYLDVFRPFLVSRREQIALAMLDRSKERKEMYPDDTLAGHVTAIDELLTLFESIVSETRLERMIHSQSPPSAVGRYDNAQRDGLHDPVLGANEPISDPDNPRYDTAPGDLRPEDDY